MQILLVKDYDLCNFVLNFFYCGLKYYVISEMQKYGEEIDCDVWFFTGIIICVVLR